MKTKELRVKLPADFHRRVSVAASKRMLRLGVFSHQLLVRALDDLEKEDPDGRKYLVGDDKTD